MSVKTVFKTFLGHVHKEMRRCVAGQKDFEWVKLGFGGAEGVRSLFKEKPKVVVAEEDGKAKFLVSHAQYTHHFSVEERRFKYTRRNGKEMHKFKDFDALENQFWGDYERAMKKIRQRAAAYEMRARDNASYKRYLEKQWIEKESPPPETGAAAGEEGE